MTGMALELEERSKSIDEWLALLPQTDSDITSTLSTTVSLVQTENKLFKADFDSKIKESRQKKPIWAKLILFAGLIGILDYAWLRFQAFSENEQIQVNTLEESQATTSETQNPSNSTTVSDFVPSSEPLEPKTQPTLTLTKKSPATTGESNSSGSTTVSDFVPSPNQEKKQTPATSNFQPTTSANNNGDDVNRVSTVFDSPSELKRQNKSSNKSQTTTSEDKNSRIPAIFNSPRELEQDDYEEKKSDRKKRRRRGNWKLDDDYDDDDDDDYDDDCLKTLIIVGLLNNNKHLCK